MKSTCRFHTESKNDCELHLYEYYAQAKAFLLKQKLGTFYGQFNLCLINTVCLPHLEVHDLLLVELSEGDPAGHEHRGCLGNAKHLSTRKKVETKSLTKFT